MKKMAAIALALSLFGLPSSFAQNTNRTEYAGGDLVIVGNQTTDRTGKIEDLGSRGDLRTYVKEGDTTLRGDRILKADCFITSNSDDDSSTNCKMGTTVAKGNDITIERGAIFSRD